MQDHNEIFSKRLRQLRISNGLSMREFADYLGYKNTGTISQFENNKNVPSFHSLIRIADFYGVTLDWLVGQSKFKYSEESIANAENRLYGQFDKPTKSLLKQEYPQYYSLLSRQSHYDLEMRSTILVGFQLLSSKDLWWGTQHFYDIVQGKYKKSLRKKEKRIIKLISLLKIYPLRVI